MNTIVDVVFRWLNFATLIALFVYLYNKYVKLTVHVGIAKQDAFEQSLLSRQELLESEHALLDEKIEKEKVISQQLENKIVQWTAVIDDRYAVRQSEKERITSKLYTQLKIQQELVMQQQLLSYVRLHATAQAERALQERFSDSDSQSKYIDDIIAYMKEQA